MSCRLCGAPTSRRLCRQCEIEERAEERARVRTRLESDEEDDDDDESGDDPVALPDGGAVDIGDLHAAAVLNHEGQAVLAIKGTDGGVRLHVPEDMVDSFVDTAHELDLFYGGDSETKPLISDGGCVRACPECDDARIRRRNPECPDSTANGDEQYRCRACGARFDEPITRERRGEARRSGLAKTLSETDPNGLLPDGGRDRCLSEDAPDRVEAERHARQAARALNVWSRAARVDLLDIVQDETPVRFEIRREQSHPEVAYHLTCRDCPFEALSSGDEARSRLRKAQDIHRTAFDHEVIVERADGELAPLQADGGVNK
ncbi:MAG: hypothetical protein ABEI80_09535 [Haloplanus sp.]